VTQEVREKAEADVVAAKTALDTARGWWKALLDKSIFVMGQLQTEHNITHMDFKKAHAEKIAADAALCISKQRCRDALDAHNRAAIANINRDALSMIPFDLEAVAIALGAPRQSTAAQFQALVMQSERWLTMNDEGVRRLISALETDQFCLIARDNAHAVYWAERFTENNRSPTPFSAAGRRLISCWLRRRRAFDAVATMSTERCVVAILRHGGNIVY